jgi:hypothetical protein
MIVPVSSQRIRKHFCQDWVLTSILYFLGLATTRGVVPYWHILLAAILLGFAQIFGGVLITSSGQFRYSADLCGYPYPQVLYEHFFGQTQRMELNPASPSRTNSPLKPWWGTARWHVKR